MQVTPAEAKGLMAALVNGDRRALAALIAVYGPGIRRYAAQALTVGADAEDVAQEVFLRAWRKAASYDPDKGAVSTWLYRIAVNLCIDRNRRGGFRRLVGLDSLPEPEDDAPGPEADMAARQRLARTRAAIAALPDRQRRAILLRASAELSTAEIAATLGTSEGAVEQLLVRARNTLRRAIEGEDPPQ
ncbi:RNA polymerase sigma factor [Marinibacterium sp. SX1]|uniref:RNA polymerase sigma factor n=1 Tax=Marinibacterium sp. SX1 TaxID=3388424 RepID=UPI003D16F7B7